MPTDPSQPEPRAREPEGAERTPPRQQGLGARVGRGVSWMMLATVLAKGGSFAANIVLGWLLLKEDFGVFSVALGVASIAGVFREGGIRQVLIQKDGARYDRLSGAAFALGTRINLLAGASLALLAPLLAIAYDKPITWLLVVMAIGVAISTPASIYRAKLAIDLEYRKLAELTAVSAAARYGFTIAFAFMGLGAMALALPWIIVSIVEALYGWRATGDRPWARPSHRRLWAPLFGQTRWLLTGGFALTLLRQGNYVVLGFLASSAVVGVYFFAYQLVIQLNVLLAMSLQQVLLPALTKLKDAPARHREAVLRATRVMTYGGTVLALTLAVTIDPLEQLIWRGKWHDAVPAVQAMALFFPVRMLLSVMNSGMISRGRNKQWALLTLAQGAGLMVAAGVAGFLFDEPWEFAVVVGLYFATGVLLALVIGLRTIGVRALDLLGALTPSWAIGLGCGAAVLHADASLAPWINGPALAWLGALFGGLLVAPLDDIVLQILRAMASALAFNALFVGVMRVLRPAELGEVVALAPGPVARRVRRMLLLPKASPHARAPSRETEKDES
ncbi:MAG: oligosaccharide flippase family protein [Planctomycetota bacterium]